MGFGSNLEAMKKSSEKSFKQNFIDRAAIACVQGFLSNPNTAPEMPMAEAAYDIAEQLWEERGRRGSEKFFKKVRDNERSRNRG